MMNLAQRSAAQEKRLRKKALMRLISHRRFSHLAAHEGLEFLERARPVRSQEPGQTAIGKNFSASLASSTIIRFVVGVANPLNLFSTSGARLAIASVNGHVLAKRSDVFGKATFCLPAQAAYPDPNCVARGSEQPFPLARPELVRERDRRQLRGMQDLVRIGIADAPDDIQRCSVLCTGFGKHERTAGKIESRQTPAARELRSWDLPVQPAGNHQVQHQPEIAFYSNRDSLADAPQFAHDAALHMCKWWLCGPQQKRTGQAHSLDRLRDDT